MGLINPDYREAVEMQKPGIYRATIADVTEFKAQATGTPMLKWTLAVQAGADTFAAFHNTPLTGRGAGILQRFLEAAIPHYEGGPFDPSLVVGTVLTVQMAKDPNSAFLRVVDVKAL